MGETMTLNWVSPKSGPGSIAYSLLAHGLVAAAVVAALNLSRQSAAPIEEYVDMDYETLDAPPEASPPKPVERVAQELQDQQSEVAGTQEKKEEAAADGLQERTTPQPTTPYYKIRPKYPKAALVSGTEGWVLLEIDVNEQGGVENVRVVDGEERNMFQTEARRAVEQWKYRPFLGSDGKPVRKLAHQVRVDFRLTDAEEETGS